MKKLIKRFLYWLENPHDDKIDAFCYGIKASEKNKFLPQLYETEPEAEPEPVQWPKENPYLKPAVNISVDFTSLIEGIKQLTAAFEKMVEAVKECERSLNTYPNKRVIYLATHGKPRTRKKNIKRIKKYFEREGKKRAVFAQN